MDKVLVTGAGGFIGNHLVSYLKAKGYWVRGVDLKKPEFSDSKADEFLVLDLREYKNCDKAVSGIDDVYALAADMGGMGFIAFHNAEILHNNILINTHTLEAAKNNGIKKYFFSSSACVYPTFKQGKTNSASLKESDAYPAQPEEGYGWEKLVSEQMLSYYAKENGFECRIARFHNIFGPYGAWDGERAKAPASLSRKVAYAKLTGDPGVEIWGDGKQTRSFCYIDDCVKGVLKLMQSEFNAPLNIGSEELVSINELVDIIAEIAGIKIKKKYIQGPQGVRGRNSDNALIRKILRWTPSIRLKEGLTKTYLWVEQQVKQTRN